VRTAIIFIWIIGLFTLWHVFSFLFGFLHPSPESKIIALTLLGGAIFLGCMEYWEKGISERLDKIEEQLKEIAEKLDEK
jgi:hypothetical protein